MKDTSLVNTPVHPLNLLVLDEFEIHVASLRNKTDHKYGKLIKYYIAPEALS
jgi:hypothetical protein